MCSLIQELLPKGGLELATGKTGAGGDAASESELEEDAAGKLHDAMQDGLVISVEEGPPSKRRVRLMPGPQMH